LAEESGGTTEYTFLADEHVILIGQWTGTMLVGPKEYPINLWFEGVGAMTGRIELIGVTTANNPLDAISVHQNRVTFELASRPPQKFEGEIRNDTMSGTIDIAGLMASFSVQKLAQ
jgi:hypothetical protein